MTDPFLVLLDRDGTINADKHYLDDPDGLELLPGAVPGLLRLQSAGAVLAIVTNQSGIGRGYFSAETAEIINQRLAGMLNTAGVSIAHIATCPHSPEDGCQCRKPAPGLAEECARSTGLSLAGCWVIGDKASDIGLARTIGGRGLLIGPDEAPDCGQAATVPNLEQATEFILNERGQ